MLSYDATYHPYHPLPLCSFYASVTWKIATQWSFNLQSVGDSSCATSGTPAKQQQDFCHWQEFMGITGHATWNFLFNTIPWVSSLGGSILVATYQFFCQLLPKWNNFCWRLLILIGHEHEWRCFITLGPLGPSSRQVCSWFFENLRSHTWPKPRSRHPGDVRPRFGPPIRPT